MRKTDVIAFNMREITQFGGHTWMNVSPCLRASVNENSPPTIIYISDEGEWNEEDGDPDRQTK